jgi:hypothetical protein
MTYYKTNVIYHKSCVIWRQEDSGSKGPLRKQTVEALRKGMSGRIWKQIPRPLRGKTSGVKVEDGTGFKA